jgi:protein-disulfide isomerase
VREFPGVWLAAMLLAVAAPAQAADSPTQQRQVIEAVIHDYLIQHPDVLLNVLQAAQDKMKAEARNKALATLIDRRQEIFDDLGSPVGGNPKGDITLVEFFDYRCPYCKQVEPALDALVRQDKQLRFVYKEFPVLGPTSVTASRAALAARAQGKYDTFHKAMMALKGQIDDHAVFQVAGSVGLDIAQLKRDMEAPEIDKALKANINLAEALDIHGTPGFVIGDQIVPGAVSLDELKQMIMSARKKQPE